MLLLRLEARNFLGYADADISFEGRDVVAVTGPVGAGKSSLLDMIRWSVWGEGRAPTDQLIRQGSLSCWVRSTWLISGQTVAIARTRSTTTKAGESSLDLVVDGIRTTRHTIAETQEAIVGLVGMSEAALFAGPFMVQDRADELMRARPAERKDILAQVFGVDAYEPYHEEAKRRVSALSGSIDQAEAQLARYQDPLHEELERRRNLREAEGALADAQTIAQAAVQALMTVREEASAVAERMKANEGMVERRLQIQGRLDGLTVSRQRTAAKVEERQRLIDAAIPEVTLPPPETEARDRLAKQLEETIHLREVGEATVSVRDRLISRVNELRAQAASHVCEGEPPTCQWLKLRDRAAAQLPQAEVDMAVVDEMAVKLRALLQSERELRDQLAAAEEQVNMARQPYERAVEARAAAEEARRESELVLPDLLFQLESVDGQIAEYQADIKAMTALILAGSDDRMRAAELTRQLRQATADMTETNEQVLVYQSRLGEAKRKDDEVQTAKEEAGKLSTKIAHQQDEMEVLRVIASAFHRDGIPTIVIESSLPIIENRANEILARMPGDYSVRLLTQRATKSGTQRETLDVLVITRDTERSYELLSGGQKFRVNFALRLGLTTANAHQSGNRIETILLDEGFGSQDQAGRDAMTESIGAVAEDVPLIIVMSHLPDVLDRISNRLEVAQDQEGVSIVEWAA